MIFRNALSAALDYAFIISTVLNTKTDAFGALYALNQGRIRGLLNRMVGPQDAEDLTQITFAKAAQALPAFRGDAEVSTWLYRLAVNVALDWLRSRPAPRPGMVPIPEPSSEDNAGTLTKAAVIDPPLSPEQELGHKDTHECIRREIAKLPGPHREILMLSFLGKLNDDEVANTLGITVGNAKVRLHRAKQVFKKSLRRVATSIGTNFPASPRPPRAVLQSRLPRTGGQMPL